MWIATVAEDDCDTGATASPESYTTPVGPDFHDLALATPLVQREAEDYFSKDEEAARALQELHNHPRSLESPIRAGAKRSRPVSIDNSLQENVREMLSGRYQSEQQSRWSEDCVRHRTRPVTISPTAQVAVRANANTTLGRKRVCCATEATRGLPRSNLHPAFGGYGGPGMWDGILN